MRVQALVEDFKADVINIIPAQKAGKIAFDTGLTNDKGWCPVDGGSFESLLHKNIHVLGDACVAEPLPKSGYVANSDAKVCAAAIVAAFNHGKAPQPSWINSCYSIVAPGDVFSAVMVYGYKDGKIVKAKGAGGLTPRSFDPEMRAREEQYAYSWFRNITADVFGWRSVAQYAHDASYSRTSFPTDQPDRCRRGCGAPGFSDQGAGRKQPGCRCCFSGRGSGAGRGKADARTG
ncbi:FCSD flavin-binding domain-containing protein [Thiolapillus sp.]|uniref:FCSD flavin-binding domain-containing protein n=1 Tax=Thiolapillus sp. TaxID=2017437 RepID=UPI0025CEF939